MSVCVLMALWLCSTVSPAADWPTSRGNADRTGSVDDSPGPKSGRILWVHKSTDHYVASPVPVGNSLLVSALAAFNTSSFQALSTDAASSGRVVWTKSVPYLKLPMVCAPAVVGNMVVFGDGMHQTDGAILHGVRLDTGLPLWQLSLPGMLVHLESSPTIVDGRVIIGAGSAGVICVDTSILTLDGAVIDSAKVQRVQVARWNMLLADYEREKKIDPDFAIPPSEDSLAKPIPKLVWQQGEKVWHVDAPVAVAGNRVIVASAFLDAEKKGERALYCLNLADGAPQWKTKLKFNPWGGATVAGDMILVGCSSIRLEPKDVPRGQGEVLAVSLTDGLPRWRKNLPAGVVSTIAVKGDLAVFTATDGCVRAWEVATGAERWKSDASAPYFASPAVTRDAVYVADLKGKAQAFNLADGHPIWSLDVGKDPAIQSPGMVYGGPVISQGRMYLATCNLESTTKLPTAVICIGEK
ncbi:MAG: PQQ-binding-like beta-propeller repeat protein [Planctomycetes bacterium]|nr:PQQ-binding-like beta-propeller repeat protein [Planctomycetota bacterium]